MKRLLSIIICVSMVLAGCSAGNGTVGTGATGDSASAGGTAEVSTETASETEDSSAAEEENGSGSAVPAGGIGFVVTGRRPPAPRR